MCGIAGIFTPARPASEETLVRMVRKMTHRGPDGEHLWSDGDIALGMRRLAIIDPDGGAQPLINESGTVRVIFNGEIYNHKDLRRRLAASGHQFRSWTDGEVIPHLYEERGIEFAQDLNGIFAIALWDSRSRTLILVRDHFGVKPLYFHATPSHVSFASEVKALLEDSEVPRRLDLEGLDEHLTFRFTPSPHTLIQGIEKVQPGGFVIWKAGVVKRDRYLCAKPQTRAGISFSDAADELRERLRAAVHSQMMSDRPIGVMLSGGIDSAAVVALMSERSAQVKTFTVGFEGGGDADETQLARQTAKRFGTEHHELIIGEQDFAAELDDVITMLEEPVGTSSALGFRYVAKLAREHVPVLLSGQGADEILAGYWRYVGEWLAGMVLDLPESVQASLNRASRLLPSNGSARVERGLRALRHPNDLDRFMNIYAVFTEEQKDRLYGPELRAHRATAASSARDHVYRLREEVPELDRLNQMMYVDTRLWLPDDLLLVGDKMTMAESVEMRVPFLDPTVVEFLESLPSDFKLRRGRRKAIEKTAVKRLLPRKIISRKERGFSTPLQRWLRNGMQQQARDLLLSPESHSSELFARAEMRDLLDRHSAGVFDHTRQLFSLLSLEMWCRSFVGQR